MPASLRKKISKQIQMRTVTEPQFFVLWVFIFQRAVWVLSWLPGVNVLSETLWSPDFTCQAGWVCWDRFWRYLLSIWLVGQRGAQCCFGMLLFLHDAYARVPILQLSKKPPVTHLTLWQRMEKLFPWWYQAQIMFNSCPTATKPRLLRYPLMSQSIETKVKGIKLWVASSIRPIIMAAVLGHLLWLSRFSL